MDYFFGLIYKFVKNEFNQYILIQVIYLEIFLIIKWLFFLKKIRILWVLVVFEFLFMKNNLELYFFVMLFFE